MEISVKTLDRIVRIAEVCCRHGAMLLNNPQKVIFRNETGLVGGVGSGAAGT